MRRDRLLRQLLAAAMTVWLIAAATYVLGRAFMPTFASAADITRTVTTTTTLLDPRDTIDRLPYPAAVMIISGALEGQLILDRVTGRATIGPGPDPSSNDIDIRYQGESSSTLTLIARGITVGEPRTEAMTVIVTTNGQTFSARPGDCTLLVHRFEYTSVPRDPPLPPALAATFAGELDCTIAELRSGATATFAIAFDF